MWKRWFGVVLLIALLVLPATAVGAQEGFTVLQNDHSYAFNQELVFELAVQSDQPIPEDSVELRYSIGLDSDVVNRREPEYEPGKSLTLRVREELEQGEIPPAMFIAYSWELTDEAGNTFRTDETSFVYMDDRFDWKSKTEGPITIYWYGRIDGERLLDVASAAQDRLEGTIGYQMEKPINIVVYHNKDDMEGALAPRGGSFEEEGVVLAGTVLPPGRREVMLLLGGHPDVDNTISHELSHMIVGEATKSFIASSSIPLWLDEGLAMYNQDHVGSGYREVLEDAARSGELDTVRRLVGSTRDGPAVRVNLWYAEVWSLVDYLVSEYGEDKMAELLDVFKRGATEDDALMEVYGFDRDGLTARWWQSLGAEVPPSLQAELETAPVEGAEPSEDEQSRAAEVPEAATEAPPAPESQPAEQPQSQPTGSLCFAGLAPLGLILFGALRFRRRTVTQ